MKPPRKVLTEPDLIEFAAAYSINEGQVAGRAGLSAGALRCLLGVSVLRNTGMLCYTSDVVSAALATPTATRRYLHQLLIGGYLERVGGPVAGHLVISLEGRKVIAEFGRGWQRGRHQLRALEPCAPFRRTTAKKSAGPAPVPAEPTLPA